MYITDGQWDISVPASTAGIPAFTSPATATTFLATTYGHWTRGAITTEAGFSLAANSTTLTCYPQQTTQYPGVAAGMLAAAANGLFDVATVTIYTVYMPLGGYGNVSAGVETKFFGFIEKTNKLNRTMVEFELQDPLFLLNEKVPKRVIQASCPWGFGDSNCTANLATYTQAFTATTGSNQYTLTPATAFSQAAGYFTQGVVKCVTGANAGLSQSVKLHGSGNLQVTLPWLLTVSVGDTFSVVAGCDKSATTCTQKFNNKNHFGGAIDVPVPIKAI
jgi:uncharacterized phage protein (TIGR02218 family)